MNRREWWLPLCVLLFFLGWLPGCKQRENEKQEPSGTSPRAGAEAQRRKIPMKIGIPECDEYLEKMSRCIADKVPEATRPKMESGLLATRTEWRRTATNPKDHTRLALACKLALENGKKAVTYFKCVW
jgi:hypothetical protein